MAKEEMSEQEKADALKAAAQAKRLASIALQEEQLEKELGLAEGAKSVFLVRALKAKIEALGKEKLLLSPKKVDKKK